MQRQPLEINIHVSIKILKHKNRENKCNNNIIKHVFEVFTVKNILYSPLYLHNNVHYCENFIVYIIVRSKNLPVFTNYRMVWNLSFVLTNPLYSVHFR
jgi:hypothetical protein